MRAILLAALALAPLLAPAVGADHVYSHRFVLEGRVLGAEGHPLVNRSVEFFATGDDFREACQEGHQDVTDAFGDFRFCFHKHRLEPTTQVGVRVGNASVTRPVDVTFRKAYVLLEAPNETGTPSDAWNVTHVVTGRAWRHGQQVQEGVQVFGTTVDHVPVNVTLRAGETTSDFQVDTDGFGDFRIELRLGDPIPPGDVSVEVEILGERQTRALDARTHRLHLAFLLPSEEGRPHMPAFPPSVAYPGTVTPPVSPWLVVAMVAGLVAAVAIAWRGYAKKEA